MVTLERSPIGRARLVAASAVILAAIAWSVSIVRLEGAGVGQHVSNVGLVVAAIGAAAAAVWRATAAAPGSRRSWALLALACFAWGSGQIAWTAYESVLHKEVPFPSVADIGYLLFVPLVVGALLSLPSSAARLSGRVRTILDGILIGASLLFMSWELVLGDLFAAGGDRLSQTISLAYPAGDVVIITVLVFASSRRQQRVLSGPALALTFGGLLAIAVADTGFVYLTSNGSYASGSVIDIGWFFGFASLLVAAIVHAPPADSIANESSGATPSLDRALILVPYIPVVAAAVLGAYKLASEGRLGPFLGATAMTLLLLATARQVAALFDNAALMNHLEERVAERTAQLEHSEQRFRSLVQNSSDVIIVVASDGRITYQSPAIQRVFGHAPGSAATLVELVEPEDQMRALTFLETAIGKAGESVHAELCFRRGDGTFAEAEIMAMSLVEDEYVNGVVLNMRDVTERKQLEDKLTHQAFHDSLTGLANRALFADRLQHALDQAQRRRRPLAVLYFDLDGFKATNDSLGHEAGDDLLRQVAQRLRDCSRSVDTISRCGGDEFGVLVEDLTSESEANVVAERIIDVLRLPFIVAGHQVFVSASIGIVVSEAGDESTADLLRYADLAMYHAKADRRGSYCRYESTMQAGLLARVELERNLRAALDSDALAVHYQPVVDIAARTIVGVEALARWSMGGRWISPADFIPVAESSGLILPLGELVLRTACLHAKEWVAACPGRFTVSVNLSARQLQDENLASTVARILDEMGVDPSVLVLEITESMLVGQGDDVLQVLNELRGLGLRLAIDDFGTGYSSLSYLHRFPIDILKVDRSFVEPLGRGAGPGLARSIITIARELGLRTVAEGVEHPEQVDELRRLGCSDAQGFLFSPAVPAEEIDAVLRDAYGVPETEPVLTAPLAS